MAGGNAYNFLIIFVVALGSFTYGYNSSIIGSVFGLPSFFAYFDLALTGPGASKSASIIGATNGLFAGGGMIGCGFVAWLADKVGRTRAIQIISCICITSAIIQGASVHIAMFLVGRFMAGMGAGMMDVIVPIYQSEVSPAASRGRMVGTHGFLIVIGYAMAGWTGYGCYFETNPQVQWRLCLTLQVVSPALLLMSSPWLPESPRWLIINHKPEKGLENLRRLHKKGDDPDDLFAREEFLQIRKQIELEARRDLSLRSMLKQPTYRRRFLSGMFVQCLAQSTGVLVINNYQVLLYNGLGLYGSLPLLLYSVYTSWAAFLNWVSSMIMDRAGRVRLLTIGVTGCACMLVLFTAMVAKYGGTTNKVGNGFGVLFLYLYVTFYASCIDAVTYVYCAEIFPTHMRAQGVSAAIIGLFAMTLIYTQSAPTAFANIGWKYYLVFIIIPFLGAPILYKFFPETKGLTLEEIGALFGDEVALDLSHLTLEQKEELDRNIVRDADSSFSTPQSGEIGEEKATTVHVHNDKA